MVINTNIAASRGARTLAESSNNLQNSLARLSSGSKIVNPQDDVAGLAVATRTQAQVNRTEAVQSNIGNAVSFLQTQDGYMGKVQKALDRMSELATLAQDVTKTDDDRALYDKEFSTLADYVDNVTTQSFNGISLFDSATMYVTQSDSFAQGDKFQIGNIDLGNDSDLSAATGASIGTIGDAETATDDVKAAITSVATFRATVGSQLSRLSLTQEHLSVLNENLQSSVSRIMDVDVATESARYARANILVQSGTAMLSQANALPQSALRLLQ